ncbi:SDR family NAD(P)-dependent oxidoreductase [Bradyrhizobium mercantei]|uniref:SDR family NAD(P)-dependent oxidoreductase n=1 Tax=Bradyrhizobium mercantei TaxID=1904807 RepID=UPI000975EF02|nr:SDR family NAD(P)-dependent oxidoreductase [Bradyrhizobium mercantei]
MNLNFAGRTAFVTGAANGIGLSICRALARRGTNIALADIEDEPLERARSELSETGVKVASFVVDVTDAATFEEIAGEIDRRMGPIHFLFNNAGVALKTAPVWELKPSDWDWVLGVNVLGVVNGLRAFVPGMIRHGEGGHIVNTASIGGLQVNPAVRNGSYAASKYAVVALSESLVFDLEGTGIGVSLLCPGVVATTLERSSERRPDRLGGPSASSSGLSDRFKRAAMSPDLVGERILDAMLANEFFVFTHEDGQGRIIERHERILAGFHACRNYIRDRAQAK